MDDQYAQLQVFYRELEGFNQQLRASMQEMERCHDVVDGLWRDEFRKRYDAEWDTYKQTMRRYVERGSFSYEQFLRDQLRYLEHYLFGY